MADVSSFEALLTHPSGLQAFTKYLQSEKKSSLEVEFYRAVESFRVSTNTGQQLLAEATSIYTRFLAPQKRDSSDEKKEERPAITLPKGFRRRIDSLIREVQIKTASRSMFDTEQGFVRETLRADFDKFKETEVFAELAKTLNAKSTLSENREVEPFDSSCTLSLSVKVPNQEKEIEIVLKSGKSEFTIGRDKANNLVLDDDRVSRSHARLEITSTQCEYIDLGSLKGSALNGKKILRSKLAPGDKIELGHTVITFQVKKKFSIF